jgi:GNAT superfamily N-acetyltransferase
MTLSAFARQHLRASDLARAVHAVLDDRGAPAGRFRAVVAGPDGPLADAARAVEREAAGAADHRPYEQRSRFLLVLDADRGAVAGMVRVIEGPDTPSGHRIPAHLAADGGKLWEYTVPAVLPEYRGKRSALVVSTLLYRTLIRLCRAERVRHLVARMDRSAQRNARLLGIPAEPFAHEGPATQAVYADVARIVSSIAEQAARLRRSSRPGGPELGRIDNRTLAQRRVGADLARRLATGDGLDAHIRLHP